MYIFVIKDHVNQVLPWLQGSDAPTALFDQKVSEAGAEGKKKKKKIKAGLR